MGRCEVGLRVFQMLTSVGQRWPVTGSSYDVVVERLLWPCYALDQLRSSDKHESSLSLPKRERFW